MPMKLEKKSLVSVSVVPLSDEKNHQAERTKLLTSLRCQTIRIPDLIPLFSPWPTKINPELDHLRVEVRDLLHR